MNKVQDCMHKISTAVNVVGPDETVEDVIDKVTTNADSRSAYVVDDKNHLVGIITPREMLELLGPEFVHSHGSGIAREVMATTAKDIMRPPYSISPKDDVEQALKLAIEGELFDIPVVENDIVVGNLDCLEIITQVREKRKTIA